MNGKYREFMQRQQMNNQPENEGNADETMRQFFGNSPDNEQFYANQPKAKKDINVENIPVPLKEGMTKKGFIAFGIILLIESIFLVGYFKVFDFLGGTILAILSFLLAWKVKYKYTVYSNYFFYNLTVTLKGVLNHYRTTATLLEASEKIFIYSIGIMAFQHFLLSWFSLTSILYSVGYYGMLLGIVLNLSKRKTALIYKGLFLYSILLLLMSIQNAFGGFHYVNFHTVISLFLFWYLAGLFQSLKISEFHTDENSEKTKGTEETASEEMEDIILDEADNETDNTKDELI